MSKDDNGLGSYRCLYCQKKRYVGNIYPCKMGQMLDPSPTPWGTACKPRSQPYDYRPASVTMRGETV